MATFLDGVNAIMRRNTILRGDDDAITTFSDTQHSADIQLAQVAIQSEISEISSERMIPYEHTTGTITLSASTRSYSLAADFIRFFGRPSFYDSTANMRYYEYQGGERALMEVDYQYKTNTGSPIYWYWDNTTTKKVAFYYVPDSSYDSRSLSYDYEKSVMVSNTTDTLPFHNSDEAYAFYDMAARRLRFLMDKKDAGLLSQDSTYNNAKSRLYALLRHGDPASRYGKRYG